MSPSTNNSAGALYVLISIVASGGQRALESNLMVQGIECVGGFDVTGVKGGSDSVHCSFNARNLPPTHLEASWMLGLVTDSTAFAKILHVVSIYPQCLLVGHQGSCLGR